MTRFFGPGWCLAAGLIFAFALVAGALGPDWLTPLIIVPAGAVIVRGAWPIATDSVAARDFSERYVLGGRHPRFQGFTRPFARVFGGMAVVVGAGWIVGGVAGFIQQAT